MKTQRSVYILCMVLWTCSIFAQKLQDWCGSDALRYHNRQDSAFLAKEKSIAIFTEKWKQKQRYATARTVVTIPVVVHIVWHTEEQNLSDFQITSQITAINTDFRKRNDDIFKIPSAFASLAADTEIEFCLAAVDPDGQLTSGITRTQTEEECIGSAFACYGAHSIHYTDCGGRDAWDPTQYMNIWVGRTCGLEIGRATFPAKHGDSDDGIVIDDRYFGSISATPPYHLGRTLTHEIGHYLNLEHLWGDNSLNSCSGDDGIGDTPQQYGIYLGCPSHPQATCGSVDMFMNFMNFVYDDCMYMFTHDQKSRMLAALYGPRNSLLNTLCQPSPTLPYHLYSENVQLFPNPASSDFHISVLLAPDIEIEIIMYDITGRSVFYQRRFAGDIRPIDTSHFPAGLYIVEIIQNSRKVIKKILITE